MLLALVAAFVVQTPSADDYARTWSDVQSAIRRSYYARNERKIEMEDHLAAYAEAAKAAKSRLEFRDIVNRMISEFHDSHFELDIEGDQAFYLNDSFGRAPAAKMANIGAWFKRMPDGYTVQMVLEGSSAERAGLHKGDLMVSVDGKPFTPVQGFESDVGSMASIRFKRGAQEVERRVEVSQETALDMFLRGTNDSVRVIETPDGRHFGYIHPWALVNNDFRRAVRQAASEKLANTDGFILDLRDGFGGRPEGFDEAFQSYDGPNGGPSVGYTKPLVVLINDGSRSAREVLSYELRKSGRATLVGRRTAGQVLGTMPFRVSDWATLEIPMMNIKIEGVRLEGVGVEPDITVPQERDVEGKDLDVDAAVRYLKFHTLSPEMKRVATTT